MELKPSTVNMLNICDNDTKKKHFSSAKEKSTNNNVSNGSNDNV